MPRPSAQPYAIQAVEEALRLLDLLVSEGEACGVSALSQRLALPKTKVFRLLATLHQQGYVSKGGDGIYALDGAAFEMGQKVLGRMTVLRQAKPVMEQLCRRCDEDVYLAIARGTDVLLLDMVHSSQRIAIMPLVGRRFPLNGCAMGQLLRADAQVRGPRRRRGEVVAVTEEGGCFGTVGALGSGIAEWAVPLRNGEGRMAGVLALLGPDFRLGRDERREVCLPALRDAGEIISSRLGYLPHLEQECQPFSTLPLHRS